MPESLLERALNSTTKVEIVPFGQPIVDSTGHARMVECLARLVDEGTVHNPGAFLPEASAIALQGLTVTMCDKILNRFQTGHPTRFTLNLTDDDLRSPALDNLLRRGADMGSRMLLELHESCRVDQYAAELLALRRLDYSLALDDFGTMDLGANGSIPAIYTQLVKAGVITVVKLDLSQSTEGFLHQEHINARELRDFLNLLLSLPETFLVLERVTQEQVKMALDFFPARIHQLVFQSFEVSGTPQRLI